jgi:hemolysin activation/secretion protein
MEIMLEDPAIDRLDASLGPGAQSGQSRLKVEVQESNAMVAAIRYGNSRPPSIGADSLRIDLLLRSLTGHGEAVSFYFERTSGLFERSARLELPLNARDTRLLVRYRGSTSEVVEAPFDLLDIESEARDIHVGLQHPIHRAVGERLDVGVGLDVRSSETSLAGIPFSFSPGVQNGNSDVTVIRATQSWFERKPDQVVALRSMLSFGIDALGATINPGPLPDGRYFAWLGQAQWARRLTSRGDQIIARGDTQLTPDKLLPLEKFNIGGARTVRGYRENQLVRDSGYAVSLEGRIALWRRPLPQIGLRDLKLEVAPFVDAGQSWDTDGETDDLASIGVGLRLQADGRALASVYFAHALIDAPAASGDDLQDDGIHFEVQANLSW